MLSSKLILVSSTTLFVFYGWMTARQVVRDIRRSHWFQS